MIKGVYKEFVTVKIKDNPIYDEAIFILKRRSEPKAKKRGKNDDALLFEANRILCEEGVKKPRKRFKALKKILFSTFFFVLGGSIGSLTTFFILNLY